MTFFENGASANSVAERIRQPKSGQVALMALIIFKVGAVALNKSQSHQSHLTMALMALTFWRVFADFKSTLKNAFVQEIEKNQRHQSHQSH